MPPPKILEVLRDQQLRMVAAKYLTENNQGESYSFLIDRASNEDLYNAYVRSGAPKEVNIPARIQSAMAGQARLGQWREMDENMAEARDEIRKLIDRDVMPRFETSEEYQDYMASQDDTAAGRVAAALALKSAKIPEMKGLLKVYLNARTLLDKYGAYEGLIKLAGNEVKLAAALKKGGLKVLPAMKKGSPDTSLRVYSKAVSAPAWTKNATFKATIMVQLKKYNSAGTRTAREKVRMELQKLLSKHSPNPKAAVDLLLKYGGWIA
jgi:hypothetical protein